MTTAPEDATGERLAFDFGRQRIEFTLTFADRKHLRISVHPDGLVTVTAPRGRTLKEVLTRLRRRAAWIVKQQISFARFRPVQPPRRYVSGEAHRYLGRQYRLKVVRSDDESVKLNGAYLRVQTREHNDSDRIKKLVERWYGDHGKAAILRRLAVCLEKMQRLGIPEPETKFRKMARRWGSCSRSGTITVNLELAEAPIPCIDYLLIHELCHLKHPHHGPEFQRLMSRFMPDWRRWKEKLELQHS